MTLQISDTELEPLRRLQDKFSTVTTEYGELKYDQLAINTRLSHLEAHMSAIEEERVAIVRGLQERYGSSGTVNIETGIFTPDTE